MSFDLLITNGTIIMPWGEPRDGDIGVKNGVIMAIGRNLSAAEEVFDAKNLQIFPGMIDPHVHFRDGGKGGITGVEDLSSGTRGAVLGGITSVFDMPNTTPPTIDTKTIKTKYDYIDGKAFCDVGFYVGGTKDNINSLSKLETMPGICAIKIFAGSSTGNLLVEDDESLEAVMRSGRRRIAYHSEDEYRLQARKKDFGNRGSYADHALWRDVECAFLGTRRITNLARKTGRPAHILHVSTAEELDYLKSHKDLISIEVLVNHLLQTAPEVYERLGAYAVMNPPLRDARHAEAAWAAIMDGTIDVIGSDHAPHARAAKEKPWPDCAAGLTGVQTLLPLLLNEVNKGRLSPARLAELCSAGPARIYGAVNKGRIAVGYDADFSIVDLRATRKIENAQMASPCGWTPFDGMSCMGWPIATIIRGHVAMRDGDVAEAPKGRPVTFRS